MLWNLKTNIHGDFDKRYKPWRFLTVLLSKQSTPLQSLNQVLMTIGNTTTQVWKCSFMLHAARMLPVKIRNISLFSIGWRNSLQPPSRIAESYSGESWQGHQVLCGCYQPALLVAAATVTSPRAVWAQWFSFTPAGNASNNDLDKRLGSSW